MAATISKGYVFGATELVTNTKLHTLVDSATIDLTAPGAIGGTTPAAGAFTTLGATGLITATGGQIKFPSTAVPSADPNTLDDYEEGDFTPDVQFGNAKVGITYSSRSGHYTKIGNRIFFTLNLILSAKGTSNGNAVIFGLPFVVSDDTSPAVSLALQVISFANQFAGTSVNTIAGIALEEITEAGARTTLTDANFSNTSFISACGHYTAAN